MRMPLHKILFVCCLLLFVQAAPAADATATPVNFVVQLTRNGDHHGHRRVFLQLDKILDDIGEDKVRFTVVAYEDGIQALLADNKETSQLLTKLANRGVRFEACRISMAAWGLTEAQFPLEVQFVPAGAPEVIRLQLQGYKYWRP
jgi:intracellular sulfur oxidation DsrE/DsrF family protein